MIIERTDLSDGACSFCDKGRINSKGTNLVYPYSEVTSVSSSGNGLSARFCDDCLETLKKI